MGIDAIKRHQSALNFACKYAIVGLILLKFLRVVISSEYGLRERNVTTSNQHMTNGANYVA